MPTLPDLAVKIDGMDPTTQEPLLNAGAMARRLGVKPAWLRAEAAARRIPAVAAGDTYLFDPAAVEDVLLQRARDVANLARPPVTGGTP